VAVAADGTLLIADGSHGTVDRVAADGTIHVAARPPRSDETPELVTALPDGGFAFATNVTSDAADVVTRLYRVAPGGAPRRVAGGGPFAADAPLGLARRVDGGPATSAEFDSGTALSALPDGGLLWSYEPGVGNLDGDVVTYIAPDAPGLLGVALRRDGHRVFAPGRANVVHVALTLPATVTLTAGGHSVTRALPAGQSAVPLPRRLSREAHGVTVTAADAAGRRAGDRTQVFPPGWLPTETAQLVGDAVLPDAETSDCRRFAGGRVDCMDGTPHDDCRAVSLRFAHGRLSWGVYHACRTRAHPRFAQAPRRLRRRDWHCDELDPHCQPALFGRLRELDVIPAA
jgi:hypothetical protein